MIVCSSQSLNWVGSDRATLFIGTSSQQSADRDPLRVFGVVAMLRWLDVYPFIKWAALLKQHAVFCSKRDRLHTNLHLTSKGQYYGFCSVITHLAMQIFLLTRQESTLQCGQEHYPQYVVTKLYVAYSLIFLSPWWIWCRLELSKSPSCCRTQVSPYRLSFRRFLRNEKERIYKENKEKKEIHKCSLFSQSVVVQLASIKQVHRTKLDLHYSLA